MQSAFFYLFLSAQPCSIHSRATWFLPGGPEDLFQSSPDNRSSFFSAGASAERLGGGAGVARAAGKAGSSFYKL